MVGEKGKIDDGGGGITIKVENGGSAESSCEGLQMCKRPRHDVSDASGTNSLDEEKLAAESVTQVKDKAVGDPIKRILDISSSEKVSSHAAMDNNSDDCPPGVWRKKLLEQICQTSCGSEDGLLGCIRDALLLHPESSFNIAAKKSCHSGDDNRIYTTGRMANGSPDVSKWKKGVESNGSHQTNTDLCQLVFKDVIMSENFSQLCKLLIQNFQGVKFDSFLDTNVMSERMKDGTYEKTPVFFHSDMQKVWMKLQKVGAEMVSVGKSLSEKSKSSYRKQVGGSQGCSRDAEDLVNGESKWGANTKQAESSCARKDYSCQCCGKEDGKDCLVCDSCEDMYHISCMHLPVDQIPSRSWYCSNCSANDKELPHDGCVVCKKLNSSKAPNSDVLMGESPSSQETSNDTTDQEDDREKLQRCNICRTEIDNGEEVKVCGHPYCPHKYYHVKCLTGQQLKVWGPCWYCPSCLCRACLTDDDDEKIVLCDGCDHAYHIYCMKPPRATIPRGKWFCRNCQPGIQRMFKGGKAQKNGSKRFGRKRAGGCSSGPGGVDMLLTAARALNQEEEMAESGRDCQKEQQRIS